MEYTNMKEGIFISRPNRFLAQVKIDGVEETCHVKNTGRCKELLIPEQSIVYIQDHGISEKRKTRYSLIGVRKGENYINIDSQAPNQVVEEWLKSNSFFPDLTYIKREQKYGKSRFDLYFEYNGKKCFMEVKGVTLEEDGIARFPDAPTERGIKHMKELAQCLEDGYEAYIMFVIQMKGVRQFQPNDRTHKAFGDTLREIKKKGVQIMAMDCIASKNYLVLDKEIPIQLETDQ